MFDATFGVLAERPAAVAPFVVLLWAVWRVLWPRRRRVARAVSYGVVTLAAPLFAVLFAAEYTGTATWQERAEWLIALESTLLSALLGLLDAFVAAWLRLALLGLDAVVALLDGTLANVAPALSANEFLLTVFVFEFIAGVALVTVLYEATRSGGSEWSSWLSAVGVILFVSGLTSTLFGSSVWGVDEGAVVSGFVAGIVGLALGVTTMILLARPEFGGEAPLARLGWNVPWWRRSEANGPDESPSTRTREERETL